MDGHVVDLERIAEDARAVVGGKAATLAVLSRTAGVRVPPGFCVTTRAWDDAVAAAPGVAGLARALDRAEDDATVRDLSARLRDAVSVAPVPEDVRDAVGAALVRHGTDGAWAVRSSATTEDGANASAAGQHDSVLGVVGPDAVLDAVRRCWASAWTARAVRYRRRYGAEGAVSMAVVVQRMAEPRASGVLFTADPVSGHRRTSRIEAVPGLGEELVSGRATPHELVVRDDRVVRSAAPGAPVLTPAEARGLAALGRRIEARLGAPQDVEWCLEDAGVAVVQSRPVTTLFPIPGADDDGRGDGGGWRAGGRVRGGEGGGHAESDDGAPRVLVSVGHGQMMTDPMRPLGLWLYRRTALPRMHEAAGRLFVDVAPRLRTRAGREALLTTFASSDPQTADAVRAAIASGAVPPPVDEPAAASHPAAPAGPGPHAADPADVPDLVAETEASLAALRHDLAGRTGADLIDAIDADVDELRRLLFDPRSSAIIAAGFAATARLNGLVREWLGEPGAVDAVVRSAPGNVSSEMGLALLDVADAVRPHPEVVRMLDGAGDDVLERLAQVEGGPEARDAIAGWLARWGARCPGEIDVTRPRWRDRPAALVPLLLAHVRTCGPGEAARRFARGLEDAARAERELLARLRALPDGDAKAEEVRREIARVRAFAGFREYPKLGMVQRYGIYRDALVGEAERLTRAGVLRAPDDAWWLGLDELTDVVRTGAADPAPIAARRAAFPSFEALDPPRVITGDGEVFSGSLVRGSAPADALVGLAVSRGTVEGRARVVLDPATAVLEDGDVLVTRFTDPGWTPLFVAAAALVTEVGGLTTHGAVVAREYGLPAVVGVPGATRRIPDGARVRVDGTSGWVEVLDAPAAVGGDRP